MNIECFARWQLHRVIVVYSTRRRFMISHLKFCIKYTRAFFFSFCFNFHILHFFALNNIMLSNQISLEHEVSVSNYGSVSGLVVYLNTSISDHFYPLKPFIGFQVSYSYAVEFKNVVSYLIVIILNGNVLNKTFCSIIFFHNENSFHYRFQSSKNRHF